MTRTRLRILAGVASVVVLTGVLALALASRGEPTTIAIGDMDAATTTAAPGPEPSVESPSPTEQAKATDSPTTASTPSTVADTTMPDTTFPEDNRSAGDGECLPPVIPNGASCFDPTGLEASVVAELLSGVQLVRYAEPTDLDCAGGTLVAESGGAILTIYDLPFAGGIRALPSAYGPTALIGSCEEWITWVAFHDEPSEPSAAPAITAHEFPDDVFFLWDFAWIGLTGYLGATASFSDGASLATTAAVAIDAANGSFLLADDAFGARSPRAPDGFDLLIPEGWQLVESGEPALEILLPESGSRLRVSAEPLPATSGATARDDESVDSMVDIDITVWEDIDGVRPSSWASGTETRFVSMTSTRWVREFELDDRVVTIEAEVPGGASRGEILFDLYLLDQVRIFDTVG
jgi:hypothetical protein